MAWAGQRAVTRRKALGGAAAAAALLLTGRAKAMVTGEPVEGAIAALLDGRKPMPSDRITLDVPQKYSYGITVPLTISVASPMTQADHVRRVHIFAEGNPVAEVVGLDFSPENGPARVSTRFRVTEGKHRILAFAELSDGSVLAAASEVTSDVSGCDGNSGIEPDAPLPASLPRVNLPERAAAGEIIEVPTMIPHRMETGFRTDTAGKLLPRLIINRFECRYAGRLVFAAQPSPAIAANAYFKFSLRAVETGEVSFAWYEDGGAVYRTARHITVD